MSYNTIGSRKFDQTIQLERTQTMGDAKVFLNAFLPLKVSVFLHCMNFVLIFFFD